jgi:hypothetical protein
VEATLVNPPRIARTPANRLALVERDALAAMGWCSRAASLARKVDRRLGEDPDTVLDTEGRRLRLEELPSMRALRGEHVDGAESLDALAQAPLYEPRPPRKPYGSSNF